MKLETGDSKPLLLGHRGVRPTYRHKAPGLLPAENTLAAFEYALAHGCDGFEFDVRVTQDGRQVICHDPKLCRLPVAQSSFESLCSAAGETLPCLDDVLRQFASRAYLDIEVKVPGMEVDLVRALQHTPPQRGYVVSSFLPDVLLRLHQIEPALPLGFICDRREYVSYWQNLPIDIFLPKHTLVTRPLVLQVHRQRMKLFTWTVNSPSDLIRLAATGVDGLISDNPPL